MLLLPEKCIRGCQSHTVGTHRILKNFFLGVVYQDINLTGTVTATVKKSISFLTMWDTKARLNSCVEENLISYR